MTVTTTGQRLAAGLLADGAAAAKTTARPCALCPHPIARGDRYARLVTTGRYAHLACIAGLAAPRRRVPVIR